MKKLEPGMVCRLENPGAAYHGEIVTLVEFVGTPDPREYTSPAELALLDNDYWRLDKEITSACGRGRGPFARAVRLQPLEAHKET